jgi:hypothetical protein
MDWEGDAEDDEHDGEEGEGDHWEMLPRRPDSCGCRLTTSALFCLGGSFLRKFCLLENPPVVGGPQTQICMTRSSSHSCIAVPIKSIVICRLLCGRDAGLGCHLPFAGTLKAFWTETQ